MPAQPVNFPLGINAIIIREFKMFVKYSLRIILILICHLSATNEALPQSANDIFPAVVFLQGHKGVKKTTLKGEEVEVWIKKTNTNPEPLNLTSSLSIDSFTIFPVISMHTGPILFPRCPRKKKATSERCRNGDNYPLASTMGYRPVL